METKRGFTLMELLIVMVLLSILVALTAGTYASSSKKGRDSKRKSDLASVQTALETYYNDKGAYPTGNASGQMVGCGSGDTQPCLWGSAMQDKNGTLYMVQVPSDPSSSKKYFYSSSGGSYQLYARLENTDDADVPKSGSTPQGYGGTDCGGILCNYGVASTNTTGASGRTLIDD